MTDLSTTVLVRRAALGLSDLNINNQTDYIVAVPFLGGTMAWDKRSVMSQWVDGDVLITKRKQMVLQEMNVFVVGTTQAEIMSKISTLLQAVSQENYTIRAGVGSMVAEWICDPADYQVDVTNYHWTQHKVKVRLSVPCQPNPLQGGF
jgi:hypothetical protein